MRVVPADALDDGGRLGLNLASQKSNSEKLENPHPRYDCIVFLASTKTCTVAKLDVVLCR